jgi:hypothetical protein
VRETRTRPSSKGSRKDSTTSRVNSGGSS